MKDETYAFCRRVVDNETISTSLKFDIHLDVDKERNAILEAYEDLKIYFFDVLEPWLFSANLLPPPGKQKEKEKSFEGLSSFFASTFKFFSSSGNHREDESLSRIDEADSEMEDKMSKDFSIPTIQDFQNSELYFPEFEKKLDSFFSSQNQIPTKSTKFQKITKDKFLKDSKQEKENQNQAKSLNMNRNYNSLITVPEEKIELFEFLRILNRPSQNSLHFLDLTKNKILDFLMILLKSLCYVFSSKKFECMITKSAKNSSSFDQNAEDLEEQQRKSLILFGKKACLLTWVCSNYNASFL